MEATREEFKVGDKVCLKRPALVTNYDDDYLSFFLSFNIHGSVGHKNVFPNEFRYPCYGPPFEIFQGLEELEYTPQSLTGIRRKDPRGRTLVQYLSSTMVVINEDTWIQDRFVQLRDIYSDKEYRERVEFTSNWRHLEKAKHLCEDQIGHIVEKTEIKGVIRNIFRKKDHSIKYSWTTKTMGSYSTITCLVLLENSSYWWVKPLYLTKLI